MKDAQDIAGHNIITAGWIQYANTYRDFYPKIKLSGSYYTNNE